MERVIRHLFQCNESDFIQVSGYNIYHAVYHGLDNYNYNFSKKGGPKTGPPNERKSKWW